MPAGRIEFNREFFQRIESDSRPTLPYFPIVQRNLMFNAPRDKAKRLSARIEENRRKGSTCGKHVVSAERKKPADAASERRQERHDDPSCASSAAQGGTGCDSQSESVRGIRRGWARRHRLCGLPEPANRFSPHRIPSRQAAAFFSNPSGRLSRQCRRTCRPDRRRASTSRA